MEITFTRDDLLEHLRDAPAEDVGWVDFRISAEIGYRASRILFVDGQKTIVLKDRHGPLGPLDPVIIEEDKSLKATHLELAWTRLMNFLDFMRLEGYIEEATYQAMTEDVMWFKAYALGWEDKELPHAPG
jgi:hypothetical protein